MSMGPEAIVGRFLAAWILRGVARHFGQTRIGKWLLGKVPQGLLRESVGGTVNDESDL